MSIVRRANNSINSLNYQHVYQLTLFLSCLALLVIWDAGAAWAHIKWNRDKFEIALCMAHSMDRWDRLLHTLIERFFLHWMSLQNNQVNLLHFLQVSHKSSELLRQLRSISIFLVKEFVFVVEVFSAHEHYNFIGENQPADGKKRVFVGMRREKKRKTNSPHCLKFNKLVQISLTLIHRLFRLSMLWVGLAAIIDVSTAPPSSLACVFVEKKSDPMGEEISDGTQRVRKTRRRQREKPQNEGQNENLRRRQQWKEKNVKRLWNIKKMLQHDESGRDGMRSSGKEITSKIFLLIPYIRDLLTPQRSLAFFFKTSPEL